MLLNIKIKKNLNVEAFYHQFIIGLTLPVMSLW